MEDLVNEWVSLQDQALLDLREGSERRSRYSLHLHALVLPSFSECFSSEVMLSRQPDRALAIKRNWKRLLDAEKFRNPAERLRRGLGVRLQPTIEEVEVELPLEPVTALLSRAAALSLPPYIPETVVGVDGTSYEIAFGEGFVKTLFHWWWSAPTGWELLAALLTEIQTMVEEAIAIAGSIENEEKGLLDH